MENGVDDAIIGQAIAWQQALDAADAAVDWDGFTAWLEADPRHRVAFDDIAMVDDAVDRHRAALRTLVPTDEEDETHASRSNRRWLWGGGIAAALALLIGVPMLETPTANPTIYANQSAAPSKTVTLGDGSRIALSAASAVSVDADNRHIAVTQGAAYFDVPHDPMRQLTVTADGYRITDIGTRFSVDAGGDHVAVAVASGTVTVTPPGAAAMPLRAGQRLVGDASGEAEISSVDSTTIGSWRQGRLIYANAPLAMVVSDISRYRGTPVTIDPALADRRFSGVLVIGDGSQLVSDLAGVAGLHLERRGDTDVLSGGAA